MIHDEVALRMTAADQRYTAGRRQIVECLAESSRPLSVFTLLEQLPDIPQSSAYRSLSVLTELNVTRRIAGADDSSFYELSEGIVGGHHHHAICSSCGKVVDVDSSPKLEKALADAARIASQQTAYRIDTHRMDLVGMCPACAKKKL